jgi:integrase
MARGCIRQRSPGSWQLLWREPGTGKQKTKTITGTKRDAEREMTEIQRSLNTGTYTAPTKKTVGVFLGDWIEASENTVGITTRPRYRRIVEKYLIPALGGIRLEALRAADIEKAYGGWASEGLSPATVKLHHAVLHKALESAVKWEMIPKNPAHYADLPQQKRKEREAFDDDDLRVMLERAQGTAVYPAVALGLTTGVRVGEMCGLMWSDVDLPGRRITISRTAARVSGEVVLKEPKTPRARRCIDIPVLAVDALQLLPRFSEIVFARKTGEPTDPDVMSRAVRNVCGVSMHGLRHAHTSFLIRNGVNPRAVADRLGHSRSALTLDVYTQLVPSYGGEVIAIVDNALMGPLTNR